VLALSIVFYICSVVVVVHIVSSHVLVFSFQLRACFHDFEEFRVVVFVSRFRCVAWLCLVAFVVYIVFS
jgi:hypothetical protein